MCSWPTTLNKTRRSSEVHIWHTTHGAINLFKTFDLIGRGWLALLTKKISLDVCGFPTLAWVYTKPIYCGVYYSEQVASTSIQVSHSVVQA
jgi:hypothetical protein